MARNNYTFPSGKRKERFRIHTLQKGCNSNCNRPNAPKRTSKRDRENRHDSCEFKTSLGYKVRSRIARATEKDLDSKTSRPNRKHSEGTDTQVVEEACADPWLTQRNSFVF